MSSVAHWLFWVSWQPWVLRWLLPSHPDLKHGIGFASSTMAYLIRVLKDKQLTLHAKLCPYQAMILYQSCYVSRSMDSACSGCKLVLCDVSVRFSVSVGMTISGTMKLLHALVFSHYTSHYKVPMCTVWPLSEAVRPNQAPVLSYWADILILADGFIAAL